MRSRTAVRVCVHVRACAYVSVCVHVFIFCLRVVSDCRRGDQKWAVPPAAGEGGGGGDASGSLAYRHLVGRFFRDSHERFLPHLTRHKGTAGTLVVVLVFVLLLLPLLTSLPLLLLFGTFRESPFAVAYRCIILEKLCTGWSAFNVHGKPQTAVFVF